MFYDWVQLSVVCFSFCSATCEKSLLLLQAYDFLGRQFSFVQQHTEPTANPRSLCDIGYPKSPPRTLPRALQQDYIFCMAVTLDSVQCPPQFSREQRIFYCTCFCYYYFAVLYDQPVFQS